MSTVERLDILKDKLPKHYDTDIVNDLLKRISNLEFEVERVNNILNELEKWLKEQKEWNDTEYPREFNDYGDVLDKLQELKGSDK